MPTGKVFEPGGNQRVLTSPGTSPIITVSSVFEALFNKMKSNIDIETFATFFASHPPTFGLELLKSFWESNGYEERAFNNLDFFGKKLSSLKAMNPEGRNDVFRFTNRLLHNYGITPENDNLSADARQYLAYFKNEFMQDRSKIEAYLKADPPEADQLGFYYIPEKVTLICNALSYDDKDLPELLIDKLAAEIFPHDIHRFNNIFSSLFRKNRNDLEWLFFIYKKAVEHNAGIALGDLSVSDRINQTTFKQPEYFARTAYNNKYEDFKLHFRYKRLDCGYSDLITDYIDRKDQYPEFTSYFQEKTPATFGYYLTSALIKAKSKKELYSRCLNFLGEFCSEVTDQEKMFRILLTLSRFGTEHTGVITGKGQQTEAAFQKWMNGKIDAALEYKGYPPVDEIDPHNNQTLHEFYSEPLYMAFLTGRYEDAETITMYGAEQKEVTKHYRNRTIGTFLSFSRDYASHDALVFNLFLTELARRCNIPQYERFAEEVWKLELSAVEFPEYVGLSPFTADLDRFYTFPDQHKHGSKFARTVHLLRKHNQSRKIVLEELNTLPETFGTKLLIAFLEPANEQQAFAAAAGVISDYSEILKQEEYKQQRHELRLLIKTMTPESSNHLKTSILETLE